MLLSPSFGPRVPGAWPHDRSQTPASEYSEDDFDTAPEYIQTEALHDQQSPLPFDQMSLSSLHSEIMPPFDADDNLEQNDGADMVLGAEGTLSNPISIDSSSIQPSSAAPPPPLPPAAQLTQSELEDPSDHLWITPSPIEGSNQEQELAAAFSPDHAMHLSEYESEHSAESDLTDTDHDAGSPSSVGAVPQTVDPYANTPGVRTEIFDIQQAYDWLPSNFPPKRINAALDNIRKPRSVKHGFIYAFWETPSTGSSIRPGVDLIDHILGRDVHSPTPPNPSSDHAMRMQDELRQTTQWSRRRISNGIGTQRDSRSNKGKILIKIGYTDRPRKRLQEWANKCGRDITLLLFYGADTNEPAMDPPLPRRPGSDDADNDFLLQRPEREPWRYAGSPLNDDNWNIMAALERPMPFVNQVESLTHMALDKYRIKRSCDRCNKTHREWFEIPAGPEGIREVDMIIRRWVCWSREAEYEANREDRYPYQP